MGDDYQPIDRTKTDQVFKDFIEQAEEAQKQAEEAERQQAKINKRIAGRVAGAVVKIAVKHLSGGRIHLPHHHHSN